MKVRRFAVAKKTLVIESSNKDSERHETIETSREWAQEQKAMDRRIHELAAEGCSDGEIAKTLMLSESHVSGRRQTMQAPTVAA